MLTNAAPTAPLARFMEAWNSLMTLRRRLQQHVTDVADCLSRVKTFRANAYAVHDATATEHAERIV